MAELLSIFLAITSTISASFGMLLFKKASMQAKKLLTSVPFLAGGFLFVAGTVMFVLALRFDELSVLFPITSLTYIWVMILSKIFLKEHINKLKLVSVFLIIFGTILALM